MTGGTTLRKAFSEQKACMSDVYSRLAPFLSCPEGTHADYQVKPGAVPSSFLSWRKNIFSTLFHSVYLALEIPEQRRMLYGRLIHLYRIWVTSADNLLDNEDKVVVPIDMPGSSKIMRQVVAIMAADRVLSEIVQESAESGIITQEAGARLMSESLRCLLPSAAQEATEEGGIRERPDHEHVLNVIHRLKTGLLFNVAFTGPDIAEPHLDINKVRLLKEAMMEFGLGCQLLDDVRDIARDLAENRHNYVLSWLAHNEPETLTRLKEKNIDVSERLYLQVPQAAAPAARRGFRMMKEGLCKLGASGFEYGSKEAEGMAEVMFAVLDLEGLEAISH